MEQFDPHPARNKAIAWALLGLGLLLAAALVIPNLPRRASSAPNNVCINNLRQIDGAKQQWAYENHKTNGPVTWGNVLAYLYKGQQPRCPKGGTYTLGNIEDVPTCCIKDHVLH